MVWNEWIGGGKNQWFLSRVSTLTRDIDIAILSVRLSVCMWHAGIVSKRLNILSCFPHHTIAHSFHSSFVCIQDLHEIPTGSPPCGGAKGGVWKCRNFRPITCYISEMVEDRWVYALCSEVFNKHWILFPIVWYFIAIVPRAYPGKQNVVKTLIHFTRTVENQSLAISQKWLKIDGRLYACQAFYQHWILFPKFPSM